VYQEVSPARNILASRVEKLWPIGRQGRMMRQDAVAGIRVHQETPLRHLVQHVDHLLSGDIVEQPWAA
jgi:hypothetical protein